MRFGRFGGIGRLLPVPSWPKALDAAVASGRGPYAIPKDETQRLGRSLRRARGRREGGLGCPRRRFRAVLLAAWLAALPSLAVADERLPAPQGPVLLAVSGTIARTTDGRQALFDRAMLEALGVVKLAAASPLDMQPVEFEGVLLRRLLEAVGAKGDAIEAIALNDYVAEIPVAEAKMHDVVIAFRRQGRDIPVREMGPLMILYPIAREPALDTEAVQARSVRQLARLVIGTGAKLGAAPSAAGQAAQEPAASGASPPP